MIKIKEGDVFGRLLVIKEQMPVYSSTKKMIRIFNCRCTCGNTTNVRLSNLRNGSIKSCGCLAKEVVSKRASKHRQARDNNRTSEYTCWLNMKQRCTNPKSISWKYYGNRGIIMCNRWFNSFENFYTDLGTKPSPKHSIDRINNEGNYEPTNCKWSTNSEQMSNQRISKKYAK